MYNSVLISKSLHIKTSPPRFCYKTPSSTGRTKKKSKSYFVRFKKVKLRFMSENFQALILILIWVTDNENSEKILWKHSLLYQSTFIESWEETKYGRTRSTSNGDNCSLKAIANTILKRIFHMEYKSCIPCVEPLLKQRCQKSMYWNLGYF